MTFLPVLATLTTSSCFLELLAATALPVASARARLILSRSSGEAELCLEAVVSL